MDDSHAQCAAPLAAEFALLFEQLSRPETAAPLDVGLAELATRITMPGFRRHVAHRD